MDSNSLTPFDFGEYKSFLNSWVELQPHAGHGSKAKLARAAQCQVSYVSQVLLGDAHLSLEQLERIAIFLSLTDEQIQFLLLLLQKDRAGTTTLRRRFESEISGLLQKRAQLKNRITSKVSLGPEAQGKYFSNWIFPAIHLLATAPSYGSKTAIAERLGLPPRLAEEALEFLVNHGLLSRAGSRFRAGNQRMHLPHDSAWINRHHMNWRLRALRDLELNREESLHYSSAVTISESDAGEIREHFLKAIEKAKALIKESPGEELYCFNLDFFKL